MERVLYTAAVDRDFLEALLRDPEAATRSRGLALRDPELAMLRGASAAQIRAAVAGMDTSPANLERRTFLGVVAGVAAVGLAGCDEEDVKVLGIDADDPTRGIRPDSWPADSGPGDAEPAEAAAPDGGGDTSAPSDMASFGIRPGD